MRKVVIGRGRECNVVLADTTDVVSRRQAVIVFSFWGKMTIYDTSSNGTFVNGLRLAKQEAKVVTRRDKVNFGHVWDLDWKAVKDPYKSLKAALACVVVLAALLIVGLTLFLAGGNGNTTQYAPLATDTLKADTLKTDSQVPASVSEVAEPSQREGKAMKEKASPRKVKAVKRQAAKGSYADSAAVDEWDAGTGSDRKKEAPLIY